MYDGELKQELHVKHILKYSRPVLMLNPNPPPVSEEKGSKAWELIDRLGLAFCPCLWLRKHTQILLACVAPCTGG